MEPTAVVALILLSCSPDMQSCHRAETRPAIYGGMNQCAAALLARLEGTNMIGRCRTVKGLASGQGVAVVRVTRGNGSHATSTDYLVTRTESATE